MHAKVHGLAEGEIKLRLEMLFGVVRMKMALIVRTDLSMNKGKIAAQVAHAAVQLFRNNQGHPDVEKWLKQGQPKVVLKVASLELIEDIQREAKAMGLISEAIFDAGHTQVPTGSLTVLGIGPHTEEKINQVVGHLKLL